MPRARLQLSAFLVVSLSSLLPVLGAQNQAPVKKEPSPPSSAMLMSSGPEHPVVQMPPAMPQQAMPGNITNLSANIEAVQPGAVQQAQQFAEQQQMAPQFAQQQQMRTSMQAQVFLCVLAVLE